MTMRTGLAMIVDERQRQKVEEGYRTGAHPDTEHDPTRLAAAALCYMTAGAALPGAPLAVPEEWPWEERAWKPKGALRNLIRAGALFLAADDESIEQSGRRLMTAADLMAACAQAIDLLLEEVQTDA